MNIFSESEQKKVISDFFTAYRQFTGNEHPTLKADQLKTIVDKMPCLSDGTPLKPEDYPQMIKRYFETPFRGCDYKIYHFFAGTVRDRVANKETAEEAQRDFDQIMRVHERVIQSGKP